MKHFFSLLSLALVLLLSLTSADTKKPIIIHMIGDSTMANKNITGNNLERGWGMVLPGFFSDDVEIINYAINGRSTKSFINEGRWQKVLDALQPGDYVFIEFGHNDEKITSPDRYTDADGEFSDNLRKFVRETREKKGIPVLMDAIARRQFFENPNAATEDDLFGKGITIKEEGNKLVETHIITREDGKVENYLEAPRKVAKEFNVPFIGMNAISKELIESYGSEASKELFCWFPADTYPACPKGREDNTHLNIKGARALCHRAVDAIGETLPELKPYVRHYDIVVAPDGSGDFFSVKDAIDAVPDYSSKVVTILLMPGTYKEKIVIPESKTNIRIEAKTEGKCIISYDDYAQKKSPLTGQNLGTSGSASIYIYAPNFEARGITFENTASRESWNTSKQVKGQAVAALVCGEGAVFRRCRFLGHQDTLYAYGRKSDPKSKEAIAESHEKPFPSYLQSRQLYEECYIEGTVDFIFGWAVALFDRCELHCLGNGYLTAASTPEGQDFGYVFIDCKITAEADVQTYLGRPWRNYAQTVFINCDLCEAVQPEGWKNWPNKDTGLDGSTTAFYAEYGSKGPGANPKSRVSWSHQLSKKDLLHYTKENILRTKK